MKFKEYVGVIIGVLLVVIVIAAGLASAGLGSVLYGFLGLTIPMNSIAPEWGPSLFVSVVIVGTVIGLTMLYAFISRLFISQRIRRLTAE